jgi:hypothetical protein
MKKISILLFVILTSCNPEPVAVNCQCVQNYYEDASIPTPNYLFSENRPMSDCDNWIYGADLKPDENGYLINYLKVCN